MNSRLKYKYNQEYSTDKLYFSEISFDKLMQRRINNVLLVCSTYDAFMLEEDGRINEKIFNEYASLNLRYPPQFSRASSFENAFELLSQNHYDLVITMLNIGKVDAFELANKIKKKYKDIPIVVLTHFSREVSIKLENEDLSSIDYVFSWLGNTSLLLAIIKLIEDKMNAKHDIEEVGAQAILLIEDSIRYYSSYLPNIYKLIFEQRNELMTEGLNENLRTMSMRARPKILLAKTYEEAIYFYQKFKNNLLGVITDMSYSKGGVKDKCAGLSLCEKIRKENAHLPILVQSTEIGIADQIEKLKVRHIDKYSKTLLADLRNYIKVNYGFGDFVFINPIDNTEITRANNLQSLQEKLIDIPVSSLEYHVSNNHFSRWLKARALFPIANLFASKSNADFRNVEEIRSYLIDTISNYRTSKSRGVIASYFDEYAIFSRIGDGMLGGKARGLAFVDFLIKKHKIIHHFDDVVVTIPRTVVLTTDIYDEFIEENNLYEYAVSDDNSDHDILMRFVESKLPDRVVEQLKEFIKVVKKPVAVRSSSLLEDSLYQPFAGIYSTYMISNIDVDPKDRLHQLEIAIKSVYASVFHKDSKAYIQATANMIDEEKMAVVLQEVTGNTYGSKFYPTISGVARSVNFYPIEPEKATDGVVNIALGLGKTIVDGGVSLRFCPKYPKKVLQLSNLQTTLRNTQREFYALDLDSSKYVASVKEDVNLLKLKIDDAEQDGSLNHIASTYDFQDQIMRDGINYQGKKLITFANVLKYNVFPLCDILNTLLDIGQKEMNNHVEIEFAVNLDTPPNEPSVFSFLQIRPIVEASDKMNVTIGELNKDEMLIYSESALGNGVIENMCDIVYVKPESFKSSETKKIAGLIEIINNEFIKQGKNYILIGPGRWGSSDPWLGIPVKWSQISASRLIIEAGLENYRIDPSQGTHFFQNLTSFSVGYFTINPFINEGYYDLDFLSKMPFAYEDDYIRHVHFEKPVIVQIDGKSHTGIVMKPS
jgi:CheY-like chemotaxis protein